MLPLLLGVDVRQATEDVVPPVGHEGFAACLVRTVTKKALPRPGSGTASGRWRRRATGRGTLAAFPTGEGSCPLLLVLPNCPQLSPASPVSPVQSPQAPDRKAGDDARRVAPAHRTYPIPPFLLISRRSGFCLGPADLVPELRQGITKHLPEIWEWRDGKIGSWPRERLWGLGRSARNTR